MSRACLHFFRRSLLVAAWAAAGLAAAQPVESALRGGLEKFRQAGPAAVATANAAKSVPLAVAAQSASGAAPLRILVSPDKADQSRAGDGGAVLGLVEAQAAVRQALAKMAAEGKHRPIEVLLRSGEYWLDKPLSLAPEDSGFDDAPVVYRAEKPGTVLISGAVKLGPATAKDKGAWSFKADGVDAATWAGGGQLYVGERRAVLARQPNQDDYWFIRKALPVAGEAEKDQGSEAFSAWGEANGWMAKLSAADRSRAVLNVMQSWTSSRHRLSDKPVPGGEGVRVASRPIWPFLSKGMNQRFYVENVAAALDAPGEWLGDGKEVRYLPRANDDLRNATAYLPRLDQLLVIRGDLSARRYVSHLKFQGLRFEHARYLTPADGQQDNQAASKIEAAVMVDGAQDITFESCTFAHVGGYALWLRESVRDSNVVRNDFHDLGAGAVRVGLTKQAQDDPAPTGAIKVADNRILDVGLTHPGAIGIWIGQSWDNLVAHNEIGRTSYTGISVGWSWGYAAATSGRNKILGNLLYDIGRGQLADMGAIYTLGVSPETEVAGNLIREVRAYEGYGYGAFGLYNDQGSSGIAMHDNVVVGTDSGAYYLHFGHDDVLASNVFALGRAAEVRVSKPDPQTNLQVTGNLIVPVGRQPFDGNFPPASVHFQGNQTSDAQAEGPVNQDICGSGCALRKVSLRAANEVKSLQWGGLDAATAARVNRVVQEAGPTQGDAAARALLTPMPATPRAPAIPVVLDLDAVAIGQQPVALRYSPANDLEAVHVVRLDGAPGGRCLQFNDSARFVHRSEPNAYAFLNHVTGKTTTTFSILFDGTTSFIHEWRDDGRPFKAGPSMVIDADGVKVGNRVLAKPWPGQWLRVVVSSALGDRANGSWDLELRTGDGNVQRFANLPVGTPGWNKLSWMGFISNAPATSSLCLAELRASNDSNP